MQDRFKPTPWNVVVSRRRILGASLSLGASVALSACAPVPAEQSRPTSPREISPKPEKPVNPGKEGLKTLIENLPDTQIKAYLQQIVVPYLAHPHPQAMDYAGTSLTIDDVSIQVQFVTPTSNKPPVGGTFSMRSHINEREPLYPVQKTVVQFPLLGYILDEEKARVIPRDHLLPDGTPFAEVTYPTDKEIFQGLSPEITFVGPDPTLLPLDVREEYEAYKTLVLIKEACGLLLQHTLIEETIKKLKQNCVSFYTEARKKSNEKVTAELFTQCLRNISTNNGRSVAVEDLAAYLLAFKAFGGTRFLPIILQNNSEYRTAYAASQNVNIGSSRQDLLYGAYRWAIVTPEAEDLIHNGDIRRIP